MDGSSAAVHPPDQAARQRIVDEIDRNFLVEAAAGSGKTTCLVNRLLTLAARGKLTGDSLVAAVTFTRKAAAELRDRLQRGIAERMAVAAGDERRHLEAAAGALGSCHIGTIHSFCGRLLRERPVEAGVDPDFAELDADADNALRGRAWDEFAARFGRDGDPDLAAALPALDMTLEDLRDGFMAFASYPDVESWPGEDRSLEAEGVEKLHLALVQYAATVEPFAARTDIEAKTETLLPFYRHLRAWSLRHAGEIGLPGLYPILPHFPKDPKTVQAAWRNFFGNDVKIRLEEERDRYNRLYEEQVRPFLTGLRAARYAAALRCYRRAAAIHLRLRRDARALNFGDLLLKTAALLRGYPDVRADLSRRYARILVDEVQDTDPVQAEIIFFLAGDDPAQRDWRACRPKPGALFMVGDPKQSIYRFTRADIATYALIKKCLVANGGEVLSLFANFRSQPCVVDWVNHVFQPGGEERPGRFPPEENEFSPAYVPLAAGGKTAEEQCFSGVYLLETLPVVRANPRKPEIVPRNSEEVATDEAERIAGFVRNALDTGLPIHDAKFGSRPARPDDFLVIARRKSGAGPIASALRRAGVPTRVSGDNLFDPEGAASLLALALEAVLNPDAPILQASCLKSRLFGVSDADLYDWKRSGGRFDLVSPLGGDRPSPVAEGLAVLRACGRLFRDLDPLAALGDMAEALGLWPLSCLGGDGAVESGALLTLFDRLAAAREKAGTPLALLDRLKSLLASDEFDIIPAMGGEGPAVRVMNLHKAKGLEAPVVFLTGGADGGTHPPELAVDRSSGVVQGRLAIYRWKSLFACPEDWPDWEAREKLFKQAEELRLSYVAATRAGSAMIVSARRNKDGTLKSPLIPLVDIDTPLPEAAARPAREKAPPVPPTRDEVDTATADRNAVLKGILEAGYAVERAKQRSGGAYAEPLAEALAEPETVAADGAEDFGLPPGSEAAMALGEVLHEILDSAGRLERAALEKAVKVKLTERDLPSGMAAWVADMADAVWRSDLWSRAERSLRVFREMPFTMASTGAGGKPVVVRGVADLVFEEADGWVVADYKSDNPRGRPLADLAEKHRGQLEAYAEALARAGVEVKELGIYFLRAGEYVRIGT